MEGHCWLRGFAVSGICLLLLGISGHVARGQEPDSGATQPKDTTPADGGTVTGASNDTVPASIQPEVTTTAEKTTEAPAITNEVINDTAVMPPDHTLVSPQGDKVTGAHESDVTSFGKNSTAGGSEPGATKGNAESENAPVLPTTPFPAVESAKGIVNGETTASKEETAAVSGEENTPAPNAETPSVPGEENTEVPGGETVLSGENGTTAEPSVEQTSTGAPEITTSAGDAANSTAGGTETGASNDTVPASIQPEVTTTAEKMTEAPAITNEVINDTAVMPPDHTLVSPQGDKVTGAQESDVTSFGVNSTAGGSEPGATKENAESENVPVLPTTPVPAVESAKGIVNEETSAPKEETIAGGGEENTPAPNAETPSVPGEENTEVPGGEAVLSGENGTTAEPSVEQTSTGAPEVTTSAGDAANSTEPAPVTDKPGLQWENETTTQQPEPSAASFETIHEKADYVIGDANNKPCLLATLNVTITVTYHVQEGPLKETYETTSAEIPREAVTTGSCGDNDSLLSLSWANNTFTLNITFTVTDRAYNPDGDLQMDVLQQGVNSSHSWVVNQVALSYDTSDAVIFPGASERKVQTVSLKDLHLFQTPVGSSYLCQTIDALEMEAKTVHLGFNYVHFQPFGVKSEQNTRFANETVECSRDLGVVPDQQDAYTIPLIVACCLAAAVVIIIVAYASHRYVTRKLHQSQYKQME